MHLISVDLPAPLSPTSAMTSPGYDVEVHLVERLNRAEVLGDLPQLEDRGVAHVLSLLLGGEPGGAGRRPRDSPVLLQPGFVHFAASLPAQISSFFGKSGSPR